MNSEADFTALRERMVREQLRGRDITDARVLEAMRRVPRHKFVPAELQAAAYRDIQPEDIPSAAIPGGAVRVVAGTYGSAGDGVAGPIQGLATAPLFFDVRLTAGGRFEQSLPAGHTAFVYAYAGSLVVGTGAAARALPRQQAGVLSPGDALTVTAGEDGAGFLLLAAKPLGEPVVQYGPFVMNTREEIEQAIADYQAGTLTAA